MKAEHPKPPAPPAGVATPPTPPPVSEGPSAVGEGFADLLAAARRSAFWNPKILAAVLAVVIVGGVWWYALGESRKGTSALWSFLERPADRAELEKFAGEHKDSVPGKVARMELARRLLGPDGIGQLNSFAADGPGKALANIEKARDEFTALAGELKADTTLRAECLRNAAEAEMVLVGVLKEGKSNEYRGSVENVAKLYKELAATVGETTPVGEKAAKRAAELEAKAGEIRETAIQLSPFGLSSPTPASAQFPSPSDIVRPDSLTPPTRAGATSPAPPTGPIVLPAPPTKPAAATPGVTPPPTTPPTVVPVPPTRDPAVAPLKTVVPPPATTPGK